MSALQDVGPAPSSKAQKHLAKQEEGAEGRSSPGLIHSSFLPLCLPPAGLEPFVSGEASPVRMGTLESQPALALHAVLGLVGLLNPGTWPRLLQLPLIYVSYSEAEVLYLLIVHVCQISPEFLQRLEPDRQRPCPRVYLSHPQRVSSQSLRSHPYHAPCSMQTR